MKNYRVRNRFNLETALLRSISGDADVVANVVADLMTESARFQHSDIEGANFPDVYVEYLVASGQQRVARVARVAFQAQYSGANILIEIPNNTDIESFSDSRYTVEREASLELFRNIVCGMAVSHFGPDANIQVQFSETYRVSLSNLWRLYNREHVCKLPDMVREWCQSINETGAFIVMNKVSNNV